MVNNISCFQNRDGSACVTITAATGIVQLFHNTSNSYMNLSISTNPVDYPLGNLTGVGTVQVTGPVGTFTILNNNELDVSSKGRYCFRYLYPGSYTVELTTVDGCVVVKEFEINQPLPLEYTYSVQGDGCGLGNKGLISIIATGGNAPYIYSLVITDGVNPDIEFYSATGHFTIDSIYFDPPYTITANITDGNGTGCNIEFVVNTDTPTGFSSIYSTTPVSCKDSRNGSIKLLVSGGLPPYSISLTGLTSSNAVGELTEVRCIEAEPNCTTEVLFTDLSYGNYNITVTDANECSHSHNSVIVRSPLNITYRDVLIAHPVCGNDGCILIRDIRGAHRSDSGEMNRELFVKPCGHCEDSCMGTSKKITFKDLGYLSEYIVGTPGTADICQFELDAVTYAMIEADVVDETIGGLPYVNQCPTVNGRFAPSASVLSLKYVSQVAKRLKVYEYLENNTDVTEFPYFDNNTAFPVTAPAPTPYILRRNDVEMCGLKAGHHKFCIVDKYGCGVEICVTLNSPEEIKVTI